MRVEDQRCQIQLFRDAKLTPAAATCVPPPKKIRIHLWPLFASGQFFFTLFWPNWTAIKVGGFFKDKQLTCIILPPLAVAACPNRMIERKACLIEQTYPPPPPPFLRLKDGVWVKDKCLSAI